ncbi:uncharacterized protein FPRO_01859 [Fusarium proliferatum ET1]|uniref:Uncharacterized protein n=1 Tax=Fusarium proliferatum (strain ET1) TaxID=1227346 RepID=A0A1L7V479_FUSPR|nr:uncharacterized protein FPRO_01859 [Fusarium proliferatum ET1]CZR33125.1 uncharacterized protein FPRO_01859 [Fusarium proliferatum ET1]
MVASTIITLSGLGLLNKFAIGLAGEAGTWAFKQILHSASGGSDTDKIRRDISAAVTEMRELKRTVDNPSRELPEALLQLRSDNLRESLTKIETMYDTITDLMETAVTLPEDISDAERDKKLNAIQTRLEDRLRVCSNEIPGILDRINDFLAEDGLRPFLRQAVQKAFDNSDDFMLGYWVVVVKGISLLQMAYDAPNVDFFEGALTIQRQKEKLKRQEQTFRAVVGENTVRLVEWTLLRPSTLVTLLTDEGYGIGPKPASIDDITSMSLFIGARIPVHRGSEDLDTVKMASMWKMSFGSGFNADLRHAGRFVHYSSGKCMSHDRAGVSTVKNDGQFTSRSVSWFIRPVCRGSDRYTIRAARNMSTFASDFGLSPLWRLPKRSDVRRSYLVARNMLQLEDYISSTDTGARFQIKV